MPTSATISTGFSSWARERRRPPPLSLLPHRGPPPHDPSQSLPQSAALSTHYNFGLENVGRTPSRNNANASSATKNGAPQDVRFTLAPTTAGWEFCPASAASHHPGAQPVPLSPTTAPVHNHQHTGLGSTSDPLSQTSYRWDNFSAAAPSFGNGSRRQSSVCMQPPSPALATGMSGGAVCHSVHIPGPVGGGTPDYGLPIVEDQQMARTWFDPPTHNPTVHSTPGSTGAGWTGWAPLSLPQTQGQTQMSQWQMPLQSLPRPDTNQPVYTSNRAPQPVPACPPPLPWYFNPAVAASLAYASGPAPPSAPEVTPTATSHINVPLPILLLLTNLRRQLVALTTPLKVVENGRHPNGAPEKCLVWPVPMPASLSAALPVLADLLQFIPGVEDQAAAHSWLSDARCAHVAAPVAEAGATTCSPPLPQGAIAQAHVEIGLPSSSYTAAGYPQHNKQDQEPHRGAYNNGKLETTFSQDDDGERMDEEAEDEEEDEEEELPVDRALRELNESIANGTYTGD